MTLDVLRERGTLTKIIIRSLVEILLQGSNKQIFGRWWFFSTFQDPKQLSTSLIILPIISSSLHWFFSKISSFPPCFFQTLFQSLYPICFYTHGRLSIERPCLWVNGLAFFWFTSHFFFSFLFFRLFPNKCYNSKPFLSISFCLRYLLQWYLFPACFPSPNPHIFSSVFLVFSSAPILITLFPTYSSSLLITCPNHLNCASLSLYPNCATCIVSLKWVFTKLNKTKIFSKVSDVHTRVLRNTKCNLAVPKMRTAYGQKSIAFRRANAWNKLDSEVKLAPSIQSFKTKLKALNWECLRKACPLRETFIFPFPFRVFLFVLEIIVSRFLKLL